MKMQWCVYTTNALIHFIAYFTPISLIWMNWKDIQIIVQILLFQEKVECKLFDSVSDEPTKRRITKEREEKLKREEKRN